MTSPTLKLRDLCDRNLDHVLARNVKHSLTEGKELNVEPLFDDRVVVVAGARSRWARRRKLDLIDLVEEPWVLTPPDCWTNMSLVEAFRARGLQPPLVRLTTYSVTLRMDLVAHGPYVTIFPGSFQAVCAKRHAIKVLPIELPVGPWPLAIVTLKNRTLNPVAERFVECIREYAEQYSSARAG